MKHFGAVILFVAALASSVAAVPADVAARQPAKDVVAVERSVANGVDEEMLHALLTRAPAGLEQLARSLKSEHFKRALLARNATDASNSTGIVVNGTAVSLSNDAIGELLIKIISPILGLTAFETKPNQNQKTQ